MEGLDDFEIVSIGLEFCPNGLQAIREFHRFAPLLPRSIDREREQNRANDHQRL